MNNYMYVYMWFLFLLEIEHVLDLQLNHSNAMEVTEETALFESDLRISGLSGVSFDEESAQPNVTISCSSNTSAGGGGGNLMSPTIPIPSSSASSSTSSKRNQLNTIDCEIGSKVSSEDADLLERSMTQKANREKSVTLITSSSVVSSSIKQSNCWNDQISDMAAESVIWLSHRLGPVITARNLTRNLL